MRVLVATDGSVDADNAVRWIGHLPLPPDTRYRVLTVMASSTYAPELDEAAGQMVREAAETLLEETRRELGGAAVETAVVQGDPREAIATAASEWGADLIVVGAAGLGAVKEFLLGSVSLGVVRHAPCAVLVCKGSPRDVGTITIAYDGSPGAEAAVRFVTRLRLPHHAHLRVVGVAEPVRYPASAPGRLGKALRIAITEAENERKASLEAKLEPAVVELWPRVATVDASICVGSAAPEIVRYADASATDLLVVGARGLGTMRRLLLGSVSEAVLRHASCCVLVVRSGTARAWATEERS
jgi:nucleotide-binding universal stress UspA family protein